MAEHSALISSPNSSDNDIFNHARLTEANELFLHRMREERQARRTRSVHTISPNSRPSIRSPEVFVQLEALRRSAEDEDEGQRTNTSNDQTSQSNAPAVSQQKQQFESQTPSSPCTLKIASIHGSMEDLHRPKNFRSIPVPVVQRRQSEPAPSTIAATTCLNVSISESNISVSSLDSSFHSAKDGSHADEESDEDNTDVGELLSASTSLSSISQAEVLPCYDKHSLNLLRVPVQHFLAAGIRAQTNSLAKYEAELYSYRLKNAIRHVSNSLLLNSRRSHRAELFRVRGDTSQLKLQESNLTLQLRVTRHVQANERERGAEHDRELQELKTQMANVQKTEKRTLYEIRSTEDELQSTRADGVILHSGKMDLKHEVEDALERRAALENLLDAEKQNREENANLCSNLERQICDLQTKVKDLTRQVNQWKERSGENEGVGLELKRKLDLQAKEYGDLKKLCEIEHEKMLHLTKDITHIEETLDQIEDQLEFCLHELGIEKEELGARLEEQKAQEVCLKDMQATHAKLRLELDGMQKEIQVHKALELHRQQTIINGLKFWLFVLQFMFFGGGYMEDMDTFLSFSIDLPKMLLLKKKRQDTQLQ